MVTKSEITEVLNEINLAQEERSGVWQNIISQDYINSNSSLMATTHVRKRRLNLECGHSTIIRMDTPINGTYLSGKEIAFFCEQCNPKLK